jgi:hypothetical protein
MSVLEDACETLLLNKEPRTEALCFVLQPW